MAYGDFIDLNRGIATNKVLHNKAFGIAKIQNLMDINVDLLQWFINLDKKLLMKILMKIFLIKI